jgi:hypothetical protein
MATSDPSTVLPGRDGWPASGERRSRGHDAARRHFFVGRMRELTELRTALDDVFTGRGRLLCIAGEPGIGKTRLATELAGYASGRGARVLWGHCWEGGGALANWPWIQILRTLLQAPGRPDLGPGAAWVARLVPELRTHVADLPELPAASLSLEPDRTRFYLFDAVGTLLKAAFARQPALLVLDDLHAADLPSLHLLRFVARELRHSPVLLLGAYRDLETRAAAISGVFGDLAREGQTIHLTGLSEPEIGELIERTAAVPPAQGLAAIIHQATGGNPFFAEGVVRMLTAEGRLVGDGGEMTARRLRIPEEVREAIRRRLCLLPEVAHRLLTVAALLGNDFERAVLEAAAGTPREQTIEALGEAARAAIVVETSPPLGRYRFAHALVRETLYADLSPSLRAELHGRVGAALEAVHGPDLDPHLSALSHHFYEAMAVGGPGKAIDYALRAGRRAMATFAWEEAVRQFERVLQALGHISAEDSRRLPVLLDLGDALYRVGDLPRSRDTFFEALVLARRAGTPADLARAALGFSGEFIYYGSGEQARIEVLEEALAALGGEESELCARVLAWLGRELVLAGQAERARLLQRQAVDVARRTTDRATLAYTLMEWHFGALGRGTRLEARLAASEEAFRLAHEVGNKTLVAGSRLHRIVDLIERGDVRASEADLDAYARLAREIRHPYHLWAAACWQTEMSLLKGRFEEAEARGNEAITLGQGAPRAAVFGVWGLQWFMLRREQGRLAELEPVFRSRAPRSQEMLTSWRCTLALLDAELGREAAARSGFEELAADDFAHLPQLAVWPLCVALVSEVCRFLSDAARAATLYRLLEGYSGRNLQGGFLGVSLGSADYYLGLLAAAASWWNVAARHFDTALAMHARMGARPALARTRHQYGRMLLDCGQQKRGLDLLGLAAAAARELGMQGLLAQSEALARGAAAADNVFRLEGDVWTIARGGRVFRLPDMKGLHYLHRLLREPRRAMPCLLLQREDAAAVADRRHLDDLREELEEAERFNDCARASRVREEMQTIGHQLAGNEDPAARRAAERIRVNVTRAIREAIAKIRRHDAVLARHLSNAIHTGMACSYDPETEISWTL